MIMIMIMMKMMMMMLIGQSIKEVKQWIIPRWWSSSSSSPAKLIVDITKEFPVCGRFPSVEMDWRHWAWNWYHRHHQQRHRHWIHSLQHLHHHHYHHYHHYHHFPHHCLIRKELEHGPWNWRGRRFPGLSQHKVLSDDGDDDGDGDDEEKRRKCLKFLFPHLLFENDQYHRSNSL